MNQQRTLNTRNFSSFFPLHEHRNFPFLTFSQEIPREQIRIILTAEKWFTSLHTKIVSRPSTSVHRQLHDHSESETARDEIFYNVFGTNWGVTEWSTKRKRRRRESAWEAVENRWKANRSLHESDRRSTDPNNEFVGRLSSTSHVQNVSKRTSDEKKAEKHEGIGKNRRKEERLPLTEAHTMWATRLSRKNKSEIKRCVTTTKEKISKGKGRKKQQHLQSWSEKGKRGLRQCH